MACGEMDADMKWHVFNSQPALATATRDGGNLLSKVLFARPSLRHYLVG
jgi:hypothetical protein